MTIPIFCGPTLYGAEVGPDIELLPPAKQGDLYRAAKRGAPAIGLIDGCFDQAPAVAHKEILWAMARGIHVFGASSMGALRAAELEAFGMEGVGAIFAQYRDGTLEDDDDVAVAHATAEHGYRPLSEAMVNIRATFAAAASEGVIQPDTHHALVQIAKALFYEERRYPLILAIAERQSISPADVRALRDFLPAGRVDLKRRDALALLTRMAEHPRTGPEAKKVRYVFSHTEAWESLRRRIEAEGPPPA
ncbi:TfuA-like protein [Pendulispora albinea]|uniref:TfuA-like core domain-containing protein n=1 Tax=Pendulispora albinea TaxID=2741071 RepID=A0ABZ2LZ61_9BACT